MNLILSFQLVHRQNLGLEISTRVFVGKSPNEVSEIHTAGLLMIALITAVVGVGLFLCGEPIQKFFFKDVTPTLLLLAVGLLFHGKCIVLWRS